MTKCRLLALVVAMFMAPLTMVGFSDAKAATRDSVEQAVDRVVRPLLEKEGIPGMAVGVLVAGKPRVFNYGLASLATRQPVTKDTLFELGSISKTFTATLASWAQERRLLSLSDPVEKYLPALKGHPFGAVTLLELGTHTPGGLPLQVPEGVRNDDQLLAYLKAWKPSYAPGSYRTYNNIGIGVLGLITARHSGLDFTTLMQRRVFSALSLKHTFLKVPAGRMRDYAQGYTREGEPIRMAAGELAAEAYGVRSTAADMLRFLQANMRMSRAHASLQRAIIATHTGYFRAGPMTQDLIWEQYPYPVELETLLQGNGPSMIFDPSPVTAIQPHQRPGEKVWINKTGSTNGFAAYVAFIPSKRLGIVMLANRSFPIGDRVTAAYRILASLASAR